MSENPRVEKKLLEEIDTVFEGKLPDYETIKNTPYLTAVIDETLRLFPPVSFDPKYSVKDDVLPNGFKVPKDSQVAWVAYGMGRSAELFPQPETFKPERWLDVAENGGRKIGPYDSIPFQAGPRICLGKTMAYLEVKTNLIMILQRFRLQMVENHPVKLIPSVTLSTQFGVKMIVSKRN